LIGYATDGRKPMSDDDDCFSSQERQNIAHDPLFGFRIQLTCKLVQDQDLPIVRHSQQRLRHSLHAHYVIVNACAARLARWRENIPISISA
jgi:hypothetical protein